MKFPRRSSLFANFLAVNNSRKSRVNLRVENIFSPIALFLSRGRKRGIVRCRRVTRACNFAEIKTNHRSVAVGDERPDFPGWKATRNAASTRRRFPADIARQLLLCIFHFYHQSPAHFLPAKRSGRKPVKGST